MPKSETPEVEEIEIDLLLEAIFRRYGYDFRDYVCPSLLQGGFLTLGSK